MSSLRFVAEERAMGQEHNYGQKQGCTAGIAEDYTDWSSHVRAGFTFLHTDLFSRRYTHWPLAAKRPCHPFIFNQFFGPRVCRLFGRARLIQIASPQNPFTDQRLRRSSASLFIPKREIEYELYYAPRN